MKLSGFQRDPYNEQDGRRVEFEKRRFDKYVHVVLARVVLDRTTHAHTHILSRMIVLAAAAARRFSVAFSTSSVSRRIVLAWVRCLFIKYLLIVIVW